MPAASLFVASVLSEITDTVTTAIGDYGLYAVFVLMLVDAVFPAASEVVMVYGGAVASGAFVGPGRRAVRIDDRGGLARVPRDRACGDDRVHDRLGRSAG